jgi:hypothetical protein
MNEIQLLDMEPVAQPAQRRELATTATPTDLLRIAVEQGADLDKLERLMALQERWEAGEAKKAYDAAFSAFKAEAVKIIKNREVTAGPLNGKRYAELFAVVNAITPALSRHGLSSSWKITKDEKDWIEVTCSLKHVGGHTESVSMGGPPDAGGAKNAIQARASTVSYLERYTLKAITGMSEQDDDTDGNERAAADWMARVTEAADEDELRKISREGSQSFTAAKNVPGYAAFMKAVQKRGAEIKGAAHA